MSKILKNNMWENILLGILFICGVLGTIAFVMQVTKNSPKKSSESYDSDNCIEYDEFENNDDVGNDDSNDDSNDDVEDTSRYIIFTRKGCQWCTKLVNEINDSGLGELFDEVESRHADFDTLVNKHNVQIKGFPTIVIKRNGHSLVGYKNVKLLIKELKELEDK